MDEEPTSALESVRLQRSSGAARLAFARRGRRTVLGALYQAGSAKARVMRLDNAGFRDVILLNTSGGMTDGDRLDCEVRWEEGAAGMVATQAAERIYRSRGGAAEIATTLRVGAGARAVWAPQETILYDGGRFRRRTEAAVEAGGRLVACEAVVLGRAAMGEIVRRGSIDDSWRVRAGDRVVYADGLRLEGDIAAALARPAVGGGAAALATALYVGPCTEEARDRVRSALAGAGAVWGCTSRLGVTVVRLLARAAMMLRAALEAALGALVSSLADPETGPPSLPRAWSL